MVLVQCVLFLSFWDGRQHPLRVGRSSRATSRPQSAVTCPARAAPARRHTPWEGATPHGRHATRAPPRAGAGGAGSGAGDGQHRCRPVIGGISWSSLLKSTKRSPRCVQNWMGHMARCRNPLYTCLVHRDVLLNIEERGTLKHVR